MTEKTALTHGFLSMLECPLPLLGQDLLHKLNAQVTFAKDVCTATYPPGDGVEGTDLPAHALMPTRGAGMELPHCSEKVNKLAEELHSTKANEGWWVMPSHQVLALPQLLTQSSLICTKKPI